MARHQGSKVPEGKLQNISRKPKKIQTLLVAVPGVGTETPERWSWFDAIPSATAPGLGVYAFQYGMNVSNNFAWEGLLSQGKVFLTELQRLIADEKLDNCPIILVSHSLGGFIVKEALRSAYEQYHTHFLRTLAAVILLGTPHSTEEDERKWQNALRILQLGRTRWTIGESKWTITPADVARLVKSSMLFEQAAVSIPTPVLSVYETQDTKVWLNTMTSKVLRLVSKEFVTTGASNEELLGLDSDHRNLYNINIKAKSFDKICEFIATSLEDARLRRESPIYQIPPALEDWGDVYSPGFDQAKEWGAAEDSSDRPTRSGTFSPIATAGTSDLGFELIPVASQTFKPESPKLPCHIIPLARNRDFFGRADVLQQLDDAFFSQPRTSDVATAEIKTFAICGPGGIGKTQIAAEFVHSRKDRFDAIFWVWADEATKLAEGFDRIAFGLGLISEDSVDARDQVVTRNLAIGWLTNPVKSSGRMDKEPDNQAKWLLVFDNVDDPEILEDYWPLDGPGCVLFTSRDPLARDPRFLATIGIDLNPFSTEETSEFLMKLTNKQGDSQSVAERLGGIPLAITQMAGIILRRDLSFSEFVSSYDEEERRGELFKLRVYPQGRHTDYKKTLWSVWALESLKHGASLLDVISMLDPDGIPERILTTFPDRVSLDTFPKTASAYQRARTELLQTSLITKDNTAQKILVHRLIQDAARSKMDPTRFRRTFSTALELVSSVWPYEAFDWRHGVARWRICEELFPHVLRLKRFGAQMTCSNDSFDADVIFCRLLTDAGWYCLQALIIQSNLLADSIRHYHETGNSIESMPFFTLAQDIAKSLKSSLPESSPGSDVTNPAKQLDSIIAETHHNLGCIGTETNQPKFTLDHFKIFNEMMMNEIGDGPQGKDKRLAISWNELGNAYMMNKEWEKGEECFKKSISTAQRLDNFVQTDVSFPYVNLGLAYWLLGRLEEAVKTLLEGLGHRETAYGVDDRNSFITGRFLHALGNVKASQGLLDESFSYHKKALNQYKSTIGNNHHRTGDVHVKVADHYRRLSQHADAMEHYNEALRIFGERVIYKREKARATFKKCMLLKSMQRSDEANIAREESFRLYRAIEPERTQPMEDLIENDFDEIVAFWSR